MLSCFSSCCSSPVDQDGSQKPLWTVPLTDGGLIFGAFPIINTELGLLFIGAEGNKRTLFFIDKANGAIKWKWSDYFSSAEDVYVSSVHLFQNKCTFYNTGNIYSLDLEKGTSLWRIAKRGDGIDGISGLGTTFFYANDTSLEKGNLTNQQTEKLFSIENPTGYRMFINAPLAFINQNSDTMLLTTRGGLQLMNSTAAAGYLLLYNLTKRQLLYDSVQQDNTRFGLPEIVGNKVYMALGLSLQCNDLQTGRLLWRKKFESNFIRSGLTVSDGKVFAGCEDTNFYCLDAETGNTLWQLNGIAGGSHKPFVMNGVVYFTRTLLYAVDTQTGQYLWKRECPEQTQSGSVYFFGRVTGSDGKIYVQSYKSAYCYKAAR